MGASRLGCPAHVGENIPGDSHAETIYCLLLLFAGLVTLSFAADENRACKGDPDKWQQLFNGKDLTGWKHVGPGHDTVEDGLIHTHGGMGLLYWTAGKIGNCEIHVVYKMRDENDNSGVFIRIPVEPREEWMPVTTVSRCRSTTIPRSRMKTNTIRRGCCIR